MFLSFGKKRTVTKRKKTTGKTMYCIKRTRAGRRVVKVLTVKRGTRVVRIYASTRRVLAKSVKCYSRKSQATAMLKKLKTAKKKTTKRRRASRFGAASSVKKAGRSYGYTVCEDPNPVDGNKKYKVCKYYKINFDGQTYYVVYVSDTYGSGKRAFMLPEGARRFHVANGSGKTKDREQRAKAVALAKNYTMLKHAAPDLVLTKCIDDGSTSPTGMPYAGSTGRMFEGLTSQGKTFASRLAVNDSNSKSIGNIAQGMNGYLGKIHNNPSNVADKRFYLTNPSYRDFKMEDSNFRARNTVGDWKTVNFGRRINYGFSNFF